MVTVLVTPKTIEKYFQDGIDYVFPKTKVSKCSIFLGSCQFQLETGLTFQSCD